MKNCLATLFALMFSSIPMAFAGTSDSGGANGVNKKAFESFIRSPLDLPAFRLHLVPIFENLGKGEPGERLTFESFAFLKPWYFAPVDLEQIENEALGVTFIKKKTDQIALQTGTEVWFDSRKIDPNSKTKAAADIILHEIVMTMYLLKFVPSSEFCKTIAVYGGESCGPDVQQLDRLLPPEKPRKLIKTDYENIRFVTNWLKTAASTSISKEQVLTVLRGRGFDQRFFNPKIYETSVQPKALKVSYSQLITLLNGIHLVDHFPNSCLALEESKRATCSVTFEASSIVWGPLKSPGIKFRIQLADQPEIVIQHLVGEEAVLTPIAQTDGQAIYRLGIGDFKAKVQVGDRVHTGWLTFKGKVNGSHHDLELDSIAIKPGIVVSADKSEQIMCRARQPRIKQMIDSTLFMNDGTTEPTDRDRYLLYIDVIPACIKENVGSEDGHAN